MGLLGRYARQACTTRNVLLGLSTALVIAVAVVVPTGGVASGLARRMADGIGHAFKAPSAAKPAASLSTTSNAQSFDGVPAVGALFYETGKDDLGQHFCTASVVNSPVGDIAVTAAHCVTGNYGVTGNDGVADGNSQGTLVFAPGYENGKSPYGIWKVSQVYTDAAWQSSQDPDDDVAFLKIAPASDGVPIEDVTGAETLDTSAASHELVQVVGYPDGAAEPVWCENWADSFSPTQLQFDCSGYTDGTSGSPFLAGTAAATDEGTVIGVIGGYEKGGDTPSVSYSVDFGPTVAALFRTAEAGK